MGGKYLEIDIGIIEGVMIGTMNEKRPRGNLRQRWMDLVGLKLEECVDRNR